MKIWGILAISCLLTLFGCTTDTEDPTFNNPLDPILNASLPQPESIVVLIGNNAVHLSWSLPQGQEAEEFAVYRKRVDENGDVIDGLRRITTVSSTEFEDLQARNGRIYLYSVAAVVDGSFGRRSEEIEARPAAFGIVLESGAEATRAPEFSVTFNVPEGASAVQVSELDDFSDASWQPVESVTRWIPSAGDGIKTVYARFQIEGGAESLPVSDSVRLDTQAVIRSVTFDGAEVRAPGESIRFFVDAGETGGIAQVNIPNLFTALVLFDDGTDGDTPNDGVYEREMVIPKTVQLSQAAVTAGFFDALGNQAENLEGEKRLTVKDPPAGVELLAPEISYPPEAAWVRIRWTASLDGNFLSYRVHRSRGATIQIVTTITDARTTTYKDEAVAEGDTYSYRVEVVNTAGLGAFSGAQNITVPNLRAPAAVSLTLEDVSSTQGLSLTWDRSSELDFAGYRVYRNETGAVTDQDLMLIEIGNPERTYLDDTGLTENTAYYYRVYVVDQGGLQSRSNQVEGRTRNEPPPAVILSPATDVDSTGITLSWSESDVHDFDMYRVYRSEGGGVSTASHLAAEIDESNITTFRDTGLTPGTTYRYRVYVVDDGTNPGPESSGSNEIIVTTTAN